MRTDPNPRQLAGDAMTLNRIHLLAVYWAFVDVVWLVIFVLLYLS